MKKRTIKKRNIYAKLLKDPQYRQRIVKDKTTYSRKDKHKTQEENSLVKKET
tara:strand:- start:137 stop:292 length:156 start_codon:yes stop_codon:yes gene_type:complete